VSAFLAPRAATAMPSEVFSFSDVASITLRHAFAVVCYAMPKMSTPALSLHVVTPSAVRRREPRTTPLPVAATPLSSVII